MRRLGTSTKFRLFTLSINYSTKPGYRCLVVYLGTCLVAISLIVCYYKMVPFLIYVFYAQNGRSRSRDLIYIFFYRESHKLLRVIILLKFVAIGLNPQNLDHPSTFLGKLKKHPCLNFLEINTPVIDRKKLFFVSISVYFFFIEWLLP